MAIPAFSHSHVDTRNAILPVPDLPEDHQHLLEPFDTLLYSLDDLTHEKLSLHDIVEAYSILYLRLRTCPDILSSAFSVWCRGERCSRVVDVLRRDASRALAPPLAFLVQQNHTFESSSADRREVTEEDIQFARDSMDVCHHSLRVSTQILRDETFLAIFGDGIGVLLDTILNILTAGSLPSLDAYKTYALCIWALRTQALPALIISSRKEQIATALQCAVKGDMFDSNDELIIDALQAVNFLLCSHCDILPIHLHGLVSAVLPHLISPSSVLRHEAASTLSAYCSTLLVNIKHSREIRTLLSTQVLAFLEAQTCKSSVPPVSERLPDILKKAMRESNPCVLESGSAWAVTVLVCLTFLLGDAFFSHSRSLRMCLETTAELLKRTYHPLRDFHLHVWRCFIWTFACLHAQLDDGMPDNALLDRLERALRVIKQELRDGLGVSLIATLVGSSNSARTSHAWSVSQAISIVKDMLHSSDNVIRDDGLMTLRKLLSRRHPHRLEGDQSSSWDRDGLLCGALLKGTFLRMRKVGLPAILQSLEQGAGKVRQLSPCEINHHWDDLACCWIMVVQSHQTTSTSGLLDDDTFSLWEALLYQETDMTATDFAVKVSSVVIRILSQGSEQPQVSADTTETRLLKLVKHHWDIMAIVLGKSAFQAASASILLAVLKHTFSLAVKSVKDVWSGLCAELVVVGYPGILKTLAEKKSQDGEAELSKQMWLLMASTWNEADGKANLEDTLSFLQMPFGDSSWSLGDEEIDAWHGVLGRSIVRETSTRAVALLEGVSRSLFARSSKLLPSVTLKLAIVLIRHMNLEQAIALPAITLSFIDNVLVSSYSESEPTSHQATLDLFNIVHNQVIVALDPILLSLLDSLKMSLILWFKDEHHVTSEDEYNSMIIPLYRTILVRLEDTKPSLQVVFSLAPLLASAFTRIPHPAHGPFAFKKFFNSIYLTCGLPAKDYPEQLIVCAMTCLHCFGGEMIPGLELESQSQTSPHNAESQIVPDSQPGFDHIPQTEYPSKSPLSALLGMYNSQTLDRPEFVQGSSSARVRHPAFSSKSASISAFNMSQSSAMLICHAQTPSLPSVVNRAKTAQQTGRSDTSARRPDDSRAIITDSSIPFLRGSTPSLRRKRSLTTSTIPPKKRKLAPPEESVDSHVRSQSAPMTRVSSPAVSAARPRRTQPGRRMFDCVELLPYHMIRKQHAMAKGVDAGAPRSRRSSVRASADTPPGSIQRRQDDHRSRRPGHDKHKGKRKATRGQSSPREQYDDWETTVDTPEVMKFRKELMREQEVVPETPQAEFTTSVRQSLPTPTPSPVQSSPYKPHPVHQSHSYSPMIPDTNHLTPSEKPDSPMADAPPLRRAQSSSAQINLLRQARDAMTGDGLSQLQVPDLVTATKIVEEMSAALNQRMRKQLVEGVGGTERASVSGGPK